MSDGARAGLSYFGARQSIAEAAKQRVCQPFVVVEQLRDGLCNVALPLTL